MISFDPLAQCQIIEMRARLWRAGDLVREETYTLSENLYFAQELLLLLEEAGFRGMTMEAAYTGRPATVDDETLVIVARR